jgi:hypothetical protein
MTLPGMADIALSLVVLAIWAAYVIIDRIQPWSLRLLAFWATWYATLAVINMLSADAPLTTAADGAFAAWCAYLAWKRRKPRQRKPSKVAGMVRDLGHRLVVTSS